MDRKETRDYIEQNGGKFYSSTVYEKEYFDKFSPIDAYFKDMKIRNKIAKDLRKDGWIVKSSSSSCMGNSFYNLEATKEA